MIVMMMIMKKMTNELCNPPHSFGRTDSQCVIIICPFETIARVKVKTSEWMYPRQQHVDRCLHSQLINRQRIRQDECILMITTTATAIYTRKLMVRRLLKNSWSLNKRRQPRFRIMMMMMMMAIEDN